jgi:type III secretion system YscQ/HrcQ family protein
MNAPLPSELPWWQNLPQFDPAAADWRNTLLRHAATPYSASNGEALSWQWQPPLPPGDGWLPLHGASHLLWLRVDQCHGFAACPPQGWWALQGWARQVAWAIEYAPLVDGLRAALGLDLEPAPQTTPAAPGPSAWQIGFSVTGNSRHIASGVLAWPAGQKLPSLAPAAPPLQRWQALRVPARLALLQLDLPASELQQLGPGAVVLLAPQASSHWPDAILHIAGQRLRGCCEAGHVRIETLIDDYSQEQNMSDTPQATPAALVDVAQLPLRLSIELPELALPLAEVAALAPGQILPLGITPDQAQLTLRANGRPVARGQLVRLGDWLGVRITEHA